MPKNNAYSCVGESFPREVRPMGVERTGATPISLSNRAWSNARRRHASSSSIAQHRIPWRATEIAAWAQLHLGTGTRVVSDGLACFHGVTAAGCVHEPVVVGSGKAAVERPEFRWVNTILGNIKNALRGTYHAIRPKYAQRYLSEFEYRFNRRFDLPDIIPRLVYVALRTPPMPERLLKLRLA